MIDLLVAVDVVDVYIDATTFNPLRIVGKNDSGHLQRNTLHYSHLPLPFAPPPPLSGVHCEVRVYQNATRATQCNAMLHAFRCCCCCSDPLSLALFGHIIVSLLQLSTTTPQ